MPTNINFKRQHLIVKDGYFFIFDDDTDMLFQKTDDGHTAFSYPLDTLLSNPILSAEWDGVFFWTMEEGATNSMVIRRWFIENYICKQKQIINLNEVAGHKYSADTFTIEHYHTTLSGAASAGTSTLYVDDYADLATTGMYATVGPNSSGNTETITVHDNGVGYIELTDNLEYSYAIDDEVNFYKNIWLFNNFDGEDSSNGALYKINAYTGSYITKYPGAAYKDVKSSTFANIDSFTEYGAKDMLVYVKASNLLFIDISGAGVSLPYYGSMIMDNISSDEITILPVYDLSIYQKNIYRLQLAATIFGSTEQWSTYNYQSATLNSFVSSIAVDAYPNVIAANGVSSSTITAKVKDQFGQPVAGRLVYFSDDDDIGSISGGTPINTDSQGNAVTAYTAGTSAREVKIIATVEQT